MKIVVFCPNWVGDLVMATPAFRAIRERFHDAEIVGVIRPPLQDVLDGTFLFDRFIAYHPRGADRSQRGWPFLRQLRKERFDLAVLFTHSLRSALLAKLGGIPRRVGFRRDGRGLLLTDGLEPKKYQREFIPSPVMEDYMTLAYYLGCAPESFQMELSTTPKEEQSADHLWDEKGLDTTDTLITLNPGGAFGAAKHWPLESFVQLSRQLIEKGNRRILVLCGPAEREVSQRIVQQVNDPRVTGLFDQPLGLGLTKACIRRSDILVTTDSGPRHFAAAFNIPVVTLFGPTHQAWSNTSYSKETALQKELPCGPCQKRECPLGHHECMTELHVDDVAKAVEQQLTKVSCSTSQKLVSIPPENRSRKTVSPTISPYEMQAAGKFTRWAMNPKFASLLKVLPLHSFDAMMHATTGHLVGEHQSRHIAQLQLPDDQPVSSVYLKREFSSHWKDLFVPLLKGLGVLTKSRCEWEHLWALRKQGIFCPEPIAYAQTGWIRPRGFLALAPLPGVPLFQFWKNRQWAENRKTRHRIIRTIAESVAHLHNAGFDQPDLYSKHLWIELLPETCRIFFIDFQRSRRLRKLSLRVRWKNLASLNASVSAGHATWTDRLLFLRHYLKTTGLDSHFRHAVKSILTRNNRLKKRHKFRQWDSLVTKSSIRTQPIFRLDKSHMWINKDFRQVLSSAGFSNVKAIMKQSSGTLLRRLPNRENWRYEFTQKNHSTTIIGYLKRHCEKKRLWKRLNFHYQHQLTSEGCQEAHNVLTLERNGILCMRLMAFGEHKNSQGQLESFLLTEEVPNAIPLDSLLRDTFQTAPYERQGQTSRLVRMSPKHQARRTALRTLTTQIADIARQFHDLGFNHRDFYCCHFLVSKRQDVKASSLYKIHMIDLQRMQYRRHFRGRWIVKDLAQLSYSAPPKIIGSTDRMRFFKHYLGIRKLHPKHKRLAKQILSKQARIARRGIAP